MFDLPESTPEDERGGTEALTPRHAQFAHGFPHWFQSPGNVSDTKRTTKFWVRKREVRIQFKQKISKQIADDSDAVKGSTQQREGTRKMPVMMK